MVDPDDKFTDRPDMMTRTENMILRVRVSTDFFCVMKIIASS